MSELRVRALGVVVAASVVGACGSVPVDDQRADRRLIPATGVLRGTVTYRGPRPCTRGGHVVGNAVLLVFDEKLPPPPQGLATTAVNFATVPGDVLFPSEPRTSGAEARCPKDEGDTAEITTSAPFAISPLGAGDYVLEAFYDTTGNFFPTFEARNLPEAGDVAGGYVDTRDAAEHADDPSYQPVFLPIHLVVPPEGAVVDGIPVFLGATLSMTRPYFHTSAVVTMTQDHHVLAQPKAPLPNLIDAFQASFASVRLDWGVAEEETAAAIDGLQPFRMQIAPPPAGGLVVWSGGTSIPETATQALQVPEMWPRVVAMKLDLDRDPLGLTPQGDQEKPIVVLQAITLWEDSLVTSVLSGPGTTPGPANVKDHVTALLRPSVVCFDARHVDRGGVLVTPHLTGTSPDTNEPPDKPIADWDAVKTAEGKLVREIRRGCLPTGTYALNVVYPTGQAWTVPNESGVCAPSEGVPAPGANPSSCSTKARPVLASQGMRGVLQIVPPKTAEGIALCAGEAPVPRECVANGP